MPRPRRWPPVISNHRGRARIRINGEEHYLGPYGSAEAQRNYARLIAQAVSGETTPADGLTVGEVVNLFLAHADRSYSRESGQVVRFEQALRVVLAECPRLPAADFKVPQLEAVRRRMVSQAWCRNHINRQVIRVRTMFRWAEREGFVPEGRWQHLRALACLGPKAHGVKHTPPRRPCTREELDAVKRHAVPVVAAMLEVQWVTGMRSCEVRILRPCDLDREDEVWLFVPQHHKTEHLGQPRVVALGPEAQRVLLPWLQAIFAADLPDTTYLFRGLVARRTREGEATIGDAPYTCHGYAQAVRRAAQKAGLKDFCPYMARHAARLRITRTHGVDAARAVLGQQHISTALQYARGQDVQTAMKVAKEAG